MIFVFRKSGRLKNGRNRGEKKEEEKERQF